MSALAVSEGESRGPVPGVAFLRLSQPQPRAPAIYEPGVVFIGGGRKRGYLAGQTFHYDSDNYLVLSVPLPAECEVLASPDEPLVSMRIDVDIQMLGELLLDMDGQEAFKMPSMTCGIAATPLKDSLRGAVERLLVCLTDPLQARVLGRQRVREVLFHVLQDRQGETLRAVAARKGAFAQINKALRRIHADCSAALGVGSLAQESGMSLSAFHRHFRAVTSTSPTQYIKAIRLHRARFMMIQENQSAGAAAALVGYESVSQFSREYKRMFQTSPRADTAGLRSG